LQETGEVDADFALLDPRDIITKDLDELRMLALEKKEKQAEKSAGDQQRDSGASMLCGVMCASNMLLASFPCKPWMTAGQLPHMHCNTWFSAWFKPTTVLY
jgi:hypothetical protein